MQREWTWILEQWRTRQSREPWRSRGQWRSRQSTGPWQGRQSRGPWQGRQSRGLSGRGSTDREFRNASVAVTAQTVSS